MSALCLPLSPVWCASKGKERRTIWAAVAVALLGRAVRLAPVVTLDCGHSGPAIQPLNVRRRQGGTCIPLCERASLSTTATDARAALPTTTTADAECKRSTALRDMSSTYTYMSGREVEVPPTSFRYLGGHNPVSGLTVFATS